MRNKVGYETRNCKFCEAPFELNVRRYGLNWLKKMNRGIFCSRKCYYEHRKGMRVSPETEFAKGRTSWDKHPRFKSGIWAYRQFIKSKCEDCESSEKLQVHHIDKNRSNNILANLRTLCLKCHWKMHLGKVPWNKGRKIYV